MINRELIRIKVIQLSYAYSQNGSNDSGKAEKELLFSLSKAYELYNFMLLLIVAVTEEAKRRYEIVEQRLIREGKASPEKKFINNRFAAQLKANEQLQEFAAKQKFQWADEPDLLAKLFSLIESSDFYGKYMADAEDCYEADRELWRKIYKTVIQDNEDIDLTLEEQSIYWNDDRDVVDSFVLKTIKRFSPENGSKQELIAEYETNEESDFATKLFRAAILRREEWQNLVAEASKNWDFDRLALMDKIIMQIAIAEMMTFPNIPISVSINEYVELSKYYSTPRSFSYINGMLDAIATKLVESGRLIKPHQVKRQ